MTEPLTKKQIAFAWTVRQLAHAIEGTSLDRGEEGTLANLSDCTVRAMACWRRAMTDPEAGPDADRNMNWLRLGHALIDQVIWWQAFGIEQRVYQGALVQQAGFAAGFYRDQLDTINPAMRAGPGRAA